jgi:hypothetical protein
VGVRHLCDGEQGKQDEAEDGGRHHRTGRAGLLHPNDGDVSLGTPGASSLIGLAQSDLQLKDTQVWTRWRTVRLRGRLLRGGGTGTTGTKGQGDKGTGRRVGVAVV